MEIQVTDLNGCPIKIEATDLDKAIEQADYFKDCHQVPPVPYDIVRQVYWRDMYEKLKAIKEKSNNN